MSNPILVCDECGGKVSEIHEPLIEKTPEVITVEEYGKQLKQPQTHDSLHRMKTKKYICLLCKHLMTINY